MFGWGSKPAKPLRLKAEEADDLPPLSALIQDAAFQAGDMTYDAAERHFTLRMNRFCHENKSATPLRAPSVLRINSVSKVQFRGLSPNQASQALSLLDIVAEPLDAPAHALILHFGGGQRDVRIEVECIDILLLDLAPPRRAKSRPTHLLD